MRVILNADDFGLSDDTVSATIECFEQGLLTSATLMAGMPATGRAAAYAAGRDDCSFGVHLAFVGGSGEHALSDPAAVSSLVHPDGSFRRARETRLRALLRRLPQAEIEREIVAQVTAVRDAGVEVSHVDSHRHLHKFTVFRRALEAVLPGLGLHRVRAVQDVYLRAPLSSPTFWLRHRWRRRIALAFATTDHFYMPTSAGDVGWAPLVERLEGLDGSTIEVGVHPGSAEPWRRQEREDLGAFAAAARGAGHELVSWHAIQ
jgi:chitin disaccharide deacetylase